MALLKNLTRRHTVIDETHTVVQRGKSFRPSYLERRINLIELNIPIVTAFTATASPEEKREKKEWFFDLNDGILYATCAYGMG